MNDLAPVFFAAGLPGWPVTKARSLSARFATGGHANRVDEWISGNKLWERQAFATKRACQVASGQVPPLAAGFSGEGTHIGNYHIPARGQINDAFALEPGELATHGLDGQTQHIGNLLARKWQRKLLGASQ